MYPITHVNLRKEKEVKQPNLNGKGEKYACIFQKEISKKQINLKEN